ncbi:MAG: LacI family transcriptional regulator [Bacteroidetes bacterium]|jgi:LacI family transcriptional regulator|nr:LacI family transcriptional regulator [Bacteroidota bacterium]
MKRLQLEDLSKQLGYSKTLISMVLNGKGNQYGISKKTQTAVLDAVAQLDYTPNKFAKALRTGKSYFVGLIVADISNPFYSTIAKNIEHVLFERGYNLMVCSTEENEEKEKRLVEMMLNQQGVDGVIVSTTFKDSSFYDQPRFAKTPLVFIDRLLPLFNTNYVVIDNYGGSLEIVSHLVKDGSKKIACLSISPSYLSTIEDRVNGYKDALIKNKLKQDNDLIKMIHFESINADVENAMRELLARHPDLDAVYALNNHIATALLKTLRKKEFENYNGKLKIACFDDIELFNIIDKKVVSVSQPIEEIGKNASLLMLDIIDGKQVNKSNVVLSTKVIER